MKKVIRHKAIEIRNGRSVAHIYPTGRSYTLCWRQHGMRQREVFGISKLGKAKERATEIVEALEKGADHLVEVSQDHLRYLTTCDELAQAAGLSLMQAVQDGVAMHKSRTSIKQATCLALSTALLKEKEQDGVSKDYRDQIRLVLTPFGERFKQPIHEIEPSDINAWLRVRDVGLRTRKNMLSHLRLLFTYAKSKDALLPDKPTAADRVTMAKVKATHSVEIFTVEEMEKLLKTAETHYNHVLPVLVLGAFCGVRTDGEISRIEWEDILDDQVIVAKQKVRNAGRRYAHLPPTAKVWLGRCKQHRRGLVWKSRKLSRELAACAEKAEVAWKHNGLRHSFISYRVADIQNVPQVALEAGNSVGIIHKNYRELVSKDTAQAWFKLCPTKLTAAEKKIMIPPVTSVALPETKAKPALLTA